MDHRLAYFLAEQKGHIDVAIDSMIPSEAVEPCVLHRAMRYSLFAGGKRIRPILAIVACQIVGGERASAMALAVAIECIHTYSLIHDDLPAMDDDEMRRGKPTAHKVFGEATAILAGDGLLNMAFEVLTSDNMLRTYRHDRLLKVVWTLAKASGSSGLIAGQVVDILSEGKKVDSDRVDYIVRRKTARLISASLECGAIIGGGNETQIDQLALFGEKLGVAFQIRDDILDHEGSSKELGKAVGKDQKRGKATYPATIGLEKSKILMNSEIESAIKILNDFGDKAIILRLIASYIGQRSN
ncbi:MAG: polyprenyl synthetase family protein [Desulfomonilaceae bacterium]